MRSGVSDMRRSSRPVPQSCAQAHPPHVCVSPRTRPPSVTTCLRHLAGVVLVPLASLSPLAEFSPLASLSSLAGRSPGARRSLASVAYGARRTRRSIEERDHPAAERAAQRAEGSTWCSSHHVRSSSCTRTPTRVQHAHAHRGVRACVPCVRGCMTRACARGRVGAFALWAALVRLAVDRDALASTARGCVRACARRPY